MTPQAKRGKALAELRPGAQWAMRGDDIEWLDEGQTRPTDAEIDAQVAATEYKDFRAHEYPPLTDLADALVHQSNGDDEQMEAYVAACNAVKAKYPKP